jgi:hypothetical protein
MNTFRDPATNVSLHVPHENDDPSYRGRSGQRAQEWAESGGISTGQSTKYSPIAQQRAREAGKVDPNAPTKEAVSLGQIHARE